MSENLYSPPGVATEVVPVHAFDVSLIFGLAYGIYLKSRACAVLALVSLYSCGQGVAGTFEYHKLRKAVRA